MPLSSPDLLGKKFAKEYTSLEDFKTRSPDVFCAVKIAGLLDRVAYYLEQKPVTISLTTTKIESPDIRYRARRAPRSSKWSHEKVKAEALKYKKRSHFKTGCRGAHHYAAKHGILDDVCSHMDTSAKNGYSS